MDALGGLIKKKQKKKLKSKEKTKPNLKKRTMSIDDKFRGRKHRKEVWKETFRVGPKTKDKILLDTEMYTSSKFG